MFGVPLDDEGMKVESLSGLKKRHDIALLYTIPNFHNPTGTLMSEQRRKELLAICRQEALPIIEDDVYGDLWLDGPPPQPLKASDNRIV